MRPTDPGLFMRLARSRELQRLMARVLLVVMLAALITPLLPEPKAAYAAPAPAAASAPVAATIDGAPPRATVGQGYSYRFTIGGAPAPVVSLRDGMLPPGLNLDPDGRLGGTPSLAGIYNFTLRAGNGSGPDATLDASLHVVEPIAGAGAPHPLASEWLGQVVALSSAIVQRALGMRRLGRPSFQAGTNLALNQGPAPTRSVQSAKMAPWPSTAARPPNGARPTTPTAGCSSISAPAPRSTRSPSSTPGPAAS